MKRPRTLRWLFVSASSFAVLGCLGHLGDRFVLQRDTLVRGVPGDASLLGDILDTRDVMCIKGCDRQGMALRPGDIIHVRRWAPGAVDRPNPLGAATFVDRIPLRRVASDATLHDHERQLLLDAINTNRKGTFRCGPDGVTLTCDETKLLEETLQKNSAALWNAFVTSLRLHRFIATEEEVPDAAAFAHLVVTYRPSSLLDVLDAQSPPAAAVLRKMLAPASLDGGTLQVAGIENFADSPEEAVFGTGKWQPNKDYYGNSNTVSPLVEFVTIELDAVDMHSKTWPESSWTLRDWEYSNVCRAAVRGSTPLLIDKLMLHGGMRTFGVARRTGTNVAGFESGNEATHQVVVETIGERARRAIVTLRTSLLSGANVADDDLARLYPSDLDGLWWGMPQDGSIGAVPIAGVSRCTIVEGGL